MQPQMGAKDRLFGMIVGYFGSQIACAFARLQVADRVGNGAPETDLVSAVGVHPDAGARFLRACVGVGLLSHDGENYRLTDLGELMRSDRPGSLRSFAAAIPGESHWQPWGKLVDALKTGKSPVDGVFGGDVWAYFSKNPAELNLFAGAMGDLSDVAAGDAVKAYDFTKFGKIVDVGGSHGVVLSHLLTAAPKAAGVLFDVPQVIEGAGPNLVKRGVRERVELVAGNFFERVPAGGDLYVMKHIIHDWDDEKAAVILRNCAAAARSDATLALFELVLPDQPVPNPVPYLMDLNMLVMVNGRERTAADYRALLARSGWRMTRVVPTAGEFSIVEAVKD
jgi:hypothetical protein